MSVRAKKNVRRRVMVVTGSRAEFGLLRPVMEAIEKNTKLELRVVVAGEHLLGPAQTWKEVAKAFKIDAKVGMQRAGDRGRVEHAAACARGMLGFAAAIKKLKPEWVVVLGDRIEAFAAASAASIGGVAVCHIHGGDRAEGIADEAMRHAITKLAHLHCAATKGSAERIRKMGEPAKLVHVTGSPAIDGLRSVKAMSDRQAASLGDPRAVVLLHPAGLSAEEESDWTHRSLLRAHYLVDPDWTRTGKSMFRHILILQPNGDPGREVVMEVWEFARALGARVEAHLPREQFLGLLKRLSRRGGALIGNSSCGLIECAALGLAAVNVGPRQAGRERGDNVMDVPRLWKDTGEPESRTLVTLIKRLGRAGSRVVHPYGDGRAGPRIAALLAKINPHDGAMLRKRNSY